MQTKQGEDIDPASLWQLEDDLLVLVDDDRYADSPITDDFYKVEL